jgi:hypothetical protein
VLFRSHYGFDAFYCEPGLKGAHEKGGVEGEVGRFRRNFLTPVPAVASLVELNENLRVSDVPGHDPFHKVFCAGPIHQPQSQDVPARYRSANLRGQNPDRHTPQDRGQRRAMRAA